METPENSFFFLSLHHSFGYDCKRFYNLSVINGDTLLHATGRIIHFYNIHTGELRYFKIPNDGCIGHIAVSDLTNFFLKLHGILVSDSSRKPAICCWRKGH